MCAGSPSAKALREDVLVLLRERVRFDAHLWAMTDPVTMVATSPHADVPMLPWPRLPELIRWRYLSPSQRVDHLLDRPAASLLSGTGQPGESAMWRHVLREIGVQDTAVVALADRYGVWGFLELWRTSESFTPDELNVLTALAPVLTSGLRDTVARTFVDAGEQLLPVGPAVLVLGPDLAVRRQTSGAATTLLQLLPPDEPMPPIPAAAYNVAAALVAEEEGVPLGPPWARIHLGGSRWMTAKASRLGSDIAVALEPSTPAERTDLFARAHGLSGRESEVLALVMTGMGSREIAGSLFLSEHTVNDHVKALLAKAGCPTRQVLMSRALGA